MDEQQLEGGRGRAARERAGCVLQLQRSRIGHDRHEEQQVVVARVFTSSKTRKGLDVVIARRVRGSTCGGAGMCISAGVARQRALTR